MQTIFTVGQVAKICKVAPSTVNKWFDSGRLRGDRIAGSQDRRIRRDDLVKFLKEHGMPLGELDEDQCSGDASCADIDSQIDAMCAALWSLRSKVIEPVLQATCSTGERFVIEERSRRIQFVRDELSVIKSWG